MCDTQGRGPTLPGKTVALVGAVLFGLGLLAVLAGIGVLSRPNAAASHRRHPPPDGRPPLLPGVGGAVLLGGGER
ncbi:hypothetical protein BRC66_01710, partial [Halobacteriales archaeon QH_2_66_30]